MKEFASTLIACSALFENIARGAPSHSAPETQSLLQSLDKLTTASFVRTPPAFVAPAFATTATDVPPSTAPVLRRSAAPPTRHTQPGLVDALARLQLMRQNGTLFSSRIIKKTDPRRSS